MQCVAMQWIDEFNDVTQELYRKMAGIQSCALGQYV